MPSLDDFESFFDARLRRLWPLTAHLARLLDGRLMGGTALAIHLRHRVSEDIDIMTFQSFSGRHLASRMKRHIADVYGSDQQFDVQVLTAEEGGCFARLDGVKLDVFQARRTESVTAQHMRWLAPPTLIEGVPVGSVEDILASKLDVIMYRPKLRDYIDLASIDRQTSHTLELGLEYYKQKYSYDVYPRADVLRRIVDLLESPGRIMADERFEGQRDDVLGYLGRRAPAIRDYIDESADQYDPPGAPAGAWRDSATAAESAAVGAARCGAWMPRARAHCELPSRHKGAHRRTR